MSDFEIAIERLTNWLKKHQDDLQHREFIGDITHVLLVAKEAARLEEKLAEMTTAAKWWRMAARGYILEEGEIHPDDRWPELESTDGRDNSAPNE